MADYNKIHFDPTIFNKESYRQALETLENLQNSNAKLFLTTEDVYNEAADRGVTLHVAISAQADNSLSSKIRRFFTKEPAVSIPENAIEVQLDEKTIQYLKESIHNEDPLYLTQHLDDAMNSIYHVTDKDKVKYNNAKKEAYEDSRQHPEEVKDFLDTSDPRVQLEILKEAYELDHEVQYYIPATEVKNAATATAAANISFDSDNDFLNFISEQNIRMSEDGRIPEGAIEIKLDASLGLDPVYKPADLYDLISRHEELDHAHSGFTFASEKDREEFQKLITQALGRDKEPEKALGQAPEPQPEDGKLHIDMYNFDEKSYRQALDILQKPDAKFYITAKDVVRGWKTPDNRPMAFANADDFISRWPQFGINVAIPDTPLNKIEQLFNPDLPASATAKIPDGAIEVKPGLSVIQGLKWSLDNKECLFHVDDCMWKDFSCADPKRLNDLEGLVKCVDHGLENYPNLAREVGDNKIPAFAFDQFNPVVADFRDFRHMDFTGPDADKRMFSSYYDEFRGKTHAEIHDQYGLSEKDLDSFAKNFCEYKLDAIKLDHAVKYYITQEKVNDFIDFIAEFYGKDKAQAQTATDVVKDWTFSSIQSTDEKGKIPEGAAEVCFKNESLKPEYSAVNIGDAVDLAWMISNKTIAPSEASFEYRPDAMTFASEKDWNKCQAMVEKALSNIKEHEPEQKQKSHSNSNSLSR
ncbi:MAG: hypothetical protein II152_07270 [Succinivibrionaceae bacterium]|nr:hypothetical protein [Succinivibrionaceae bacterium]